MYCDQPAVVQVIHPARDESHAGHGVVELASGAKFEIGTASSMMPGADFVLKLGVGDRVQLCCGPSQKWADEGPSARMAIVGDIETRDYFYGLAYPAGR
jgi:hypothetical protein